MPKRIQRKREKDWRIADYSNNYVMIHRPFKLGNPFDWTVYVGKPVRLLNGDLRRATPELAKEHAQRMFRSWLFRKGAFLVSHDDVTHQSYLAELEKHRGKDVVCFCKPDEPCHGDVILEYWERIT